MFLHLVINWPLFEIDAKYSECDQLHFIDEYNEISIEQQVSE